MPPKKSFLFSGKTAAKFRFLLMMFCIKAIVTQHLEMLFRDMYDKSFHKVKNRDAFGDGFIVFVTSVMKGNGVSVVVVNTRGSDNRSSKISADILDGDVRGAEVRFCTDIEAIGMVPVNVIFDLAERRPDSLGHLIQKNFAESVAKESVIKMFNGAPGREISGAAFRNKAMNMRIPFEIPSECMKDTNEAGSEVFRLIHVLEHT